MTRFLLPLLFGLLGTAILLSLGVWQMQRLEWKQGILSEIDRRIAGPAEPIPATPDPETDRYQPVSLDGTVGAEELFVLISRKQVGPGYRVVSAFETETGRRVLLDKGFVPIAAREEDRFTGPMSVTGNLHWPDERTSATPDNDVAGNTWFARDLEAMADLLGTEPLLVVAREMAPADPGVTPLPVDSSGIPNDHLQYAITWFSLAAVWLVMTGALVWRQRKGKEG